MMDFNNIRYGFIKLGDTQSEIRPIRIVIGWVPDLVKVFVTGDGGSGIVGNQLLWSSAMADGAALLTKTQSISRVLSGKATIADGTSITGALVDETNVNIQTSELMASHGIYKYEKTRNARDFTSVGADGHSDNTTEPMGGTDIQAGFYIGGTDLTTAPNAAIRDHILKADARLFWEAHRLVMRVNLEQAGGQGVPESRVTPVALGSTGKA